MNRLVIATAFILVIANTALLAFQVGKMAVPPVASVSQIQVPPDKPSVLVPEPNRGIESLTLSYPKKPRVRMSPEEADALGEKLFREGKLKLGGMIPTNVDPSVGDPDIGPRPLTDEEIRNHGRNVDGRTVPREKP